MQSRMSNFSLIMLILFCLLSVSSCQSSNSHNKQQRPRYHLSNALVPNQQISIQLNIYNSSHQIYKTKHSTLYSQKVQQFKLPLQVQIFEQMDNITMEVVFMYKDLYSQNMKQAWRGQTNLTKYKKITKMNSEEFFAGGQLGGSSSKGNKGNYTLHIAEDFNIMVIFSDMTLPGEEVQLLKRINFTISQFQLKGHRYEATYLPRLDISQLHIPYKYYKPISGLLSSHHRNISLDNTQSSESQLQLQTMSLYSSQEHLNASFPVNYTVTVHIYPYSIMKFIMFHQMFDPSQRQQAIRVNPLMGYMMEQQAMDDMKELLFTNNFYIILITMVMTLVKTILEIFALKNQFKVWNQIQKNKGLSIKVLYTDLGFQVIFFLYLVDNESNLMVTVPMVLGILVVLWKIKKTIFIYSTDSFPFFKLKHYDWCKHHQKIDNQGVKYMYSGLGLLFVAYLAYEVVISQSFSSLLTYSSLLEKIVFFMGMAGFIRMTPQLYINYKLKSVDHLPWKTLIYRFIQTIIDDFYVFLVTTPFLHKVMVFREDVIFLLYIYQRIIYRVDPNRIGTAGGMVLEKKQIQEATASITSKKQTKTQ